ncbi:MAG: cadherin-like beta sandwich domain-containing protein [Spirochaetaceae bacterium]|nr:cadherin-like beta sandwich domain-containing protein [Spirochaetaceae bacterium]
MAGVLSFVMMAAISLTACDTEIQDVAPQSPPPPRLLTLEFDDPSLILSPSFDPEEFNYSVTVEGEPVPVNITATANNETHIVETPLGQPITPLGGSLSVVSVSDAFGRRESYYIQFVREEQELPAAELSGVLLSVGGVPDFAPETTVYNNIPLPFGVESVTVFPTGAQEGSYFTYTPSPTVTLNGSGTGTVTIGVIASGYKLNTYTFHFARGGGSLSTLGTTGIALSIGALEDTFNTEPEDGEVQTIIVPYGTTGLTVLAVKANWNDTVRFDTDEPSDGKHFASPLNNKMFSITVNGGLGYVDKTYQFKIETAAGGPALLSGLTFGGTAVSGTVYRRNGDTGENLETTGFNAAWNIYNLNFEHTAENAEITATAEAGAVITVSGVDSPPPADNVVTIPVTALSSARLPVKLTVGALDDRTANEYTIYFRKSNPPYAVLESLAITGIKDAQPNIAGLPAEAAHTFPALAVYASTPFVVVNAGVPAGNYQIRYENSAGEPHNYLLPPNIHNGHINVYVSGGGDYRESVYRFDFTVLAPLVEPRLSDLRVYGNPLITGTGHDVFAYTTNIPYGGGGATEVQFQWSVDTDAAKSEYSLDYGASWQRSDSYNDNLITISPAQTKVVVIKVSTHDGAQALYNITVTKAGDGTNQVSSLSVKQNGGGSPPELLTGANTFSADTYVYTLNVENAVSAVNIAVTWPASAALYTSIDGAAYAAAGGAGTATLSNIALTTGTPKIINVQVRPQQQESFAATYTLTITRAANPAPALLNSITITSPASGAALKQLNQTTGFNQNVFDYTVPLALTNSAATLNVTWPAGSNVTYTLDGSLHSLGSSGSNTVTVNNIALDGLPKPLTLVVSGVAPRSYTILFTNLGVLELGTTGSAQTFVAPVTGSYKIECWGAQGGSVPNGGNGGNGGYSKGTIMLVQNDTLYAYVGSQGGVPGGRYGDGGGGGFNGGARGGGGDEDYYGGGGGGGASDVRTVMGDISSRIIVAGGGGGGGGTRFGGAGGGGNDVSNAAGSNGEVYNGLSNGATQTDGYQSGASGQIGRSIDLQDFTQYINGLSGGGGGGGGYYGGYANTNRGANSDSGGGGGSGWVKSATGGSGNALFTNARFTNIDGSRGVNSGDGKVVITYLGQ